MNASNNGGDGDMIRPDPLHGQVGDARYAEHYARSHEVGADTLAYRTDYVDILTLDGLMPEGYSLLDIGCGTGGYHALLTRYGRVHGIDPIPEMIAIANRFQAESGSQGCRYTCATFEDMPDTERYDAIRARGVYGWYFPWYGRAVVLDKIAALLKPSGIAVVSYVPPPSIWGMAKALLAPRKTVVIFRGRFLAMLRNAGLEPLFELRVTNNTVVFAHKPDANEIDIA